MMGIRAGAVTEAKDLCTDPYLLRDAAQHQEINTTGRYSWPRSDSANTGVKLWQGRE